MTATRDRPFVDLADPESFRAGVPHAYFDWLREHDPCAYHPEPAGPGFHAITRWADAGAVLKDAATFSSARGGAFLDELPPEELAMFRRMMLHMDPPQHLQRRQLISRGFTPRRVDAMADQIRAHARDLVDRLAGRAEVEVVAEAAADLPLLVLAELLGVPVADRGQLFAWTNRLIGQRDPTVGSRADGQRALAEFLAYMRTIAERRRAEPRDDLVSVLVHAEEAGQRLDAVDLDMFWFLLLIAGNETTRNLITGGLIALAETPGGWQRLRAEPARIPDAVEEMLRFVSPVMQFRRTLTHDAEVAGRALAAGAKVVVYYGAANRDPRVFARPHEFDPDRQPNPHLAFGIGPHSCLGASLARLEARCFFEELLARAEAIELAAPPQRLASNFVNGVVRLPVRVRWARA